MMKDGNCMNYISGKTCNNDNNCVVMSVGMRDSGFMC